MASFYGLLKPNCIRLLTFLDDTGTCCTLEEVNLNDALPYACLSYAWRDDEHHEVAGSSHILAINGQSKPIRPNLNDALSHLGPIARSQGLKFWADAICINQDDLGERAEQVKLMKRIYEQAQRVMAWTGPAVADTELAIGMMQTVSTFKHEFFVRHTQRTALHLWQAAISRQPFFQQRPKSDVLVAWAGMVQIFKRVYWGRAWVHQEITGNNITFYCGLWSFTWNELHAFNEFHGTYGGLRDMPDKYMLMLSEGVNVGSPFFDLHVAEKNRKARQTREQTLMTLIRELRLTHCSDASDKVYAALPHATDVNESCATELLRVDYSKSMADVYIDVTRYYLQQGDLEILGYIGANCANDQCRPSRKPDEKPLPSWAPDWRIPNRIRPLNAGGKSLRSYPMLYHPCPDTAASIQISDSEFHVQGFIFDTLRSIVPECGRDHVPSALKIKWGKHLKAWSPNLTSRDVKRILNADVQYTSDGLSNARGAMIDWDLLDEPIEKLRPEHKGWRHNMRHVLRSVCRDRRAGRTKANRIGIFPEMARPGDAVAAFLGGHVLYVVRPVEGRRGVFEFLGECYVDGMMDGELMEVAKKEGLQSTTLMLI